MSIYSIITHLGLDFSFKCTWPKTVWSTTAKRNILVATREQISQLKPQNEESSCDSKHSGCARYDRAAQPPHQGRATHWTHTPDNWNQTFCPSPLYMGSRIKMCSLIQNQRLKAQFGRHISVCMYILWSMHRDKPNTFKSSWEWAKWNDTICADSSFLTLSLLPTDWSELHCYKLGICSKMWKTNSTSCYSMKQRGSSD